MREWNKRSLPATLVVRRRRHDWLSVAITSGLAGLILMELFGGAILLRKLGAIVLKAVQGGY